MKKFKDKICEGKVEDMLDSIFDALDDGGKASQVILDYLDDEFINSPEYVPDETSEYYIEKMSDSQIKTLYKKIKKYL